MKKFVFSILVLIALIFAAVTPFNRQVQALDYGCRIQFTNPQGSGAPVPITINQDNYLFTEFSGFAQLIIRHTTLDIPDTVIPNIAMGNGTTNKHFTDENQEQDIVFTPPQPGAYTLELRIEDDPAYNNITEKTLCTSSDNLSVPGEIPEGAPTKAQPAEGTGSQLPSYKVDLPNESDTEIDGITKWVKITFNNLNPNYEYLACSRSGLDCAGPEFNELKKTSDSQIILEKVCGNGPDGVKGKELPKPDEDGKDCDETKDYFHEGKTYKVGLSADNGSNAIFTTAQFYVNYYYPEININNGQLRVVAQKPDKDSPKQLLFYADNKRVDKDHIFDEELPPGKMKLLNGNAPGPIEVFVNSLVKVGGKNRNDFQVQLDPVSAPYTKKTECVDLQDVSRLRDWSRSESVIFASSGSHKNKTDAIGTLPEGDYILRINERVDRDAAFGLGSDCDGRFRYYAIPVTVEKDDAGVNQVYIDLSTVEYDPDKVESRNLVDESELGSLPCTQGLDTDVNPPAVIDVTYDADGRPDLEALAKIDKCTQFQTAIGSFSVSPTGFITTLGQWLLGIGTVAAFGFMIYAGYIIQTSRGDKEKIAQAREILTSAATGLIFLILSIAILEIIGVDILQLPGFAR